MIPFGLTVCLAFVMFMHAGDGLLEGDFLL
jgi:hypothetical protein